MFNTLIDFIRRLNKLIRAMKIILKNTKFHINISKIMPFRLKDTGTQGIEIKLNYASGSFLACCTYFSQLVMICQLPTGLGIKQA